MRLIRIVCFVVLVSSLSLGQGSTSTTNSASDSSNVADELKALREAIAQQQQQITQQQQEIEKLRQQVGAQQVSMQGGSVSPRLVNASLNNTNTPNPAAQPASDAPQSPAAQTTEGQGSKSPLSFRIGAAEFTPGGFVDFENVFRTTNTGNVAATSFGAIPFSNQVPGHLTEYRSTGQYSRFNIKTTTKFGANDVTGYVEFDFNGNDPTNVFVTSNSHTDRLRLYWLDLKRGGWEFLGGQTWGLQTPNRVGVSPVPADLSLGYHEDAGIGVGYNYTRAAELRVAYHFNDKVVWAVAAQNPQQFLGNEVSFPGAFTTQLNSQFDNANNSNPTATPNVGPDVLTKIAFDTKKFWGERGFHFEAGGMETVVKVTNLPRGGTGFAQHSKVGGGVFGATSLELLHGSEGRNLKFVASGMWGNGIGRYLNGLAPNAVVFPITTSGGTTCDSTGSGTGLVVTGNCDVGISLVHSADVVGGFEFLPHPKSQFGVYYGGLYAQRNFFPDITGGTNSVGAHPFIGFGGPNSSNTNNRTVQEGTIDWQQTFWRNPQYGAVLMVNQVSYLTRAPWFVALGAPKNAHLVMGYVSLRYVLP